jgi:hypothetical protein
MLKITDGQKYGKNHSKIKKNEALLLQSKSSYPFSKTKKKEKKNK